MKVGKMALAMAAAVVSATSFAGNLSGASNLDFLAFDGQKVKKKTVLQINDTKVHQVVVEVASIVGSGSDSHFFESPPIILTFNGSTEDIQISAASLRTNADVEKFQTAPQFQIQTASGKQIDYKMDYLKGEGFMPNTNVIENLANYNAGEGKAAVAHFALMSMQTGLGGKAVKGKPMQGENIAEQQLQYWFQQADQETKKRFLEWVKKQ